MDTGIQSAADFITEDNLTFENEFLLKKNVYSVIPGIMKSNTVKPHDQKTAEAIQEKAAVVN